MRLPSTTPQPAACSAGSIFAALASASFLATDWLFGTGLTSLTSLSLGSVRSILSSFYRPRSLAVREGRTAPEPSLGGVAAAHGLAAERALRRWGLVLFPRFEAFGGQPLAEPAGFFKGLALGLDLALEHVQGPPDDQEHGVGHDHRVVGIVASVKE